MRKALAAIVFLFLLLFAFPTFVEAALLSVQEDGSVQWKVLSIEDQLALTVPERNDLEVKDIATTSPTNSSIALTKENGKVFLKVGEGEGKKELEVTNWEEGLVEIEERGDVKRIEIFVEGDNFVINQDGVFAKTKYPINISPLENKLSVETPSGEIFLSILPNEAAESALRSRYISRLPDRNINISQKDLGVLTYEVDGERVINLFNFMDYSVPVTTHVSATTGEIVSIDQPTWLRVLGFLLI